MIEEILKTLGTDVGRTATALEKLVELNERMLGSMSSVPATAETPAPAAEPEAPKPAAAKGGKGKVAAAPKPADPEPEPEPVQEEEEESDGTVVTLDDVKAIFLKASQADKKGANETFEAFKSETGKNKVSDFNDAQRAELHGRFEAVIAAAAM